MINSDGRAMYVEREYVEGAPRVMLMHAWQERLELHDLVEKVARTAKALKIDKLIIENKAAGHSVAQEIRRLYGNEPFAVQLHDPKSQDKLSRLYSVQHLFAEGLIFAPDRAWAEMLITQVGQFPKGKQALLWILWVLLLMLLIVRTKRIQNKTLEIFYQDSDNFLVILTVGLKEF